MPWNTMKPLPQADDLLDTRVHLEMARLADCKTVGGRSIRRLS
jgi:hypothetical protein